MYETSHINCLTPRPCCLSYSRQPRRIHMVSASHLASLKSCLRLIILPLDSNDQIKRRAIMIGLSPPPYLPGPRFAAGPCIGHACLSSFGSDPLLAPPIALILATASHKAPSCGIGHTCGTPLTNPPGHRCSAPRVPSALFNKALVGQAPYNPLGRPLIIR